VIDNIALKLYDIYNFINQIVREPIINLSENIDFPIIAVLLLGILGSTAPCQITTNLGAVGFISKKGMNKKTLIENTIWYILGKILVFTIYGVIISLFNIQLQRASIPLFAVIRKLMGPIVIIIGLYILGVLKLKGSIGEFLVNKAEDYVRKYSRIPASFVLGIIFSLAFCPTLFWLFFGMVVPLSIKSPIGIIYPLVFALGTLIPLMLMILLINFGKVNTKANIKAMRKTQSVVKFIGGLILIAVGFIDTITYWLN